MTHMYISSGEVIFDGVSVYDIQDRQRELWFRRQAQLIFQDPYMSLNPRMTISEIVGEPYIIHQRGKSKAERREQVVKLLKLCGLEDYHALRYAHQAASPCFYLQ